MTSSSATPANSPARSREGRAKFMLQFANQDTPEMKLCFRDPEDPETFLQSRLDPSEQSLHPEIVQLHTDLLRLASYRSRP